MRQAPTYRGIPEAPRLKLSNLGMSFHLQDQKRNEKIAHRSNTPNPAGAGESKGARPNQEVEAGRIPTTGRNGRSSAARRTRRDRLATDLVHSVRWFRYGRADAPLPNRTKCLIWRGLPPVPPRATARNRGRPPSMPSAKPRRTLKPVSGNHRQAATPRNRDSFANLHRFIAIAARTQASEPPNLRPAKEPLRVTTHSARNGRPSLAPKLCRFADVRICQNESLA